MKKYEIRYFFDKDNHIKRVVNEVDTLDVDTVLEKYAKGDYQIFPDLSGILTRVNMSKIICVKILESERS